jgi:hypothetical protein
MEYYSSPKTLGINIKLFVFILRMNWSNNLSKKLQNYYDAMKRLLDSSRLVRIHSVGMRNNAILFDQSIIRK